MLSRARERVLSRLRDRRGRAKEGGVLVEGVRSVSEALTSGVRIRFAVCSDALLRSPAGQALLETLEARGVEPDWLEAKELAALSATETSQGILLVCEEPRLCFSDLNVGSAGRFLAADGINDPGNLGTLIRAALAFNLDGVIVLDGSVDPWNAKAVRASAGSALCLPIVRGSWAEARTWATEGGVRIIVADADGTDVADVDPRPPWVLVVGSEAAGSRIEVREVAESCPAVPMRGSAESLNAGVAGAILLYELTRTRLGS